MDDPDKAPSPPPDQSSLVTAVHRLRRRLASETVHCVLTTVVLVLTLGGCALCAVYCPLCLPAITLVSLCMCPWAPYYLIPLWTSLLLFVFYFVSAQIQRVVISLQ